MTNPGVPMLVRQAAALAHAIPGVRLHVELRDGTGVLVGAGCLGALTPCQFRAALVDQERGATLLAAVARVTIVGGLVDLGAGVYARGGADDPSRWFVTTLAPDAVVDALSGSPDGVPHDAFETVLRPDDDLDVATIGLRAVHPCFARRLDEVAHWALTRCLVAELVADVALASADPDG